MKRDVNCQLDKRRQENETGKERERETVWFIQQGLFLNFKWNSIELIKRTEIRNDDVKMILYCIRFTSSSVICINY